MLFELNWRLETTLSPIILSQPDKVFRILDAFNPFPHLIELERATIKPDLDEHITLPWSRIAECWVNLAFSLVRDARLVQNLTIFRNLMDILFNVVKERPEWQARWFYEECLHNLSQFDQKGLRTSLKNWPETPDLPFWEAKRASLLAELGDFEDAERLAEQSLNKIRSRIHPYSIDYSTLSQEGWTMILLQFIKDSRRSSETDFKEMYRDRWEKLEEYRCNPRSDIEKLRLIVNGPSPTIQATRTVRNAFEPGRATITYHFSNRVEFYEYRPAFAFLQLFDEGALPMKCGAFSVFSDAVASAAIWVEPFIYRWALISLIRSERKEEIDRLFSRIRIATLNQQEVDYYSTTYSQALEQIIDDLSKSSGQINLTSPGFSQRLITTLPKLLSRLSFRFSAQQRRDLFDLTLIMYKSQLFHQFHILHQCVSNPLNSLLQYAMSRVEVLERMSDLLSLPIPTESGFDVAVAQWWPEPFASLTWLPKIKLEENFDTSAWSNPIANLVRIVREGTPEARKRASLRLAILYDLGALNNDQSYAFGAAIWSRVDDKKGLPIDLGIRDNIVLRIPEVEEGRARTNYLKYILSVEFPRLSRQEITPEGQKILKTQIDPSTLEGNPYIAELLGATPPLFISEEEKRKYIDWSVEEAVILLRKAAAWWDDDKLTLQLNRESPFGNLIEYQFQYLLDLFAELILPKLGNAAEEVKELAKRLLSEMEQFRLNILLALPMMLFIDQSFYEEASRKLRAGLNSMKVEDVAKSIYGLYFWLAHSSKQFIPAPPNDLTNELINRLTSRRQPGLLYVMKSISDILKYFPEILTNNQINSLCIALEYLLTETSIPDRKTLEAFDQSKTPIPIEEWDEYREAAAKIAFGLYRYFSRRNDQPPQAVMQWKETSQSDPLPEVKRVWD